jgi:hypothetical protein
MRFGGILALLTGLVGVVLGLAITADTSVANARPTVASAGLRTRQVAVVVPARHWYVIPRAANGCQLNVRIGPSTVFAAVAHFDRCDRSASCWFQQASCGAGTENEVAAGWYGCRDQRGGISRSNLWTVVTGPDARPAYTASGCAWTVDR